MSLEELLRQVFDEFLCRKAAGVTEGLAIHAPDPWEVDVRFTLPGQGAFRVRNLAAKDVPALIAFGDALSDTGKYFFCCYPWYESEKLAPALQAAIDAAVAHIDISYLLEHEGKPVGHFFLWKGGGNPHSRQYGVEIPELGVAIGDAYQGKGFGRLAVDFLNATAISRGVDAVELTTALDNNSGWNTYLRAGYAYVGVIRNPLDVDVTAVAAGTVVATRFRDERQMVYIINDARREAILHYLEEKRLAAQPEGTVPA